MYSEKDSLENRILVIGDAEHEVKLRSVVTYVSVPTTLQCGTDTCHENELGLTTE